MESLNVVVDGFMKEAQRDYISLPHLAYAARVDLGALTPDQVREKALALVGLLYDRGLRPGDLDGFPIKPWPDKGRQAMLDRIEREWIALGDVPNLGHPICWLELKRG